MPDDTQIDLIQTITELRQELDARTAERDEALAGQSATSEILAGVARSPADIQPVFDAIVAHAAKLCEAEFSAVARFDDGLLHLVAINNMSPDEMAAFHGLFPRPPTQGFVMGRAFLDARPVHFADVLAEPDYDPHTLAGGAVSLVSRGPDLPGGSAGRRHRLRQARGQTFQHHPDQARRDLCGPGRRRPRKRTPV